MYDETSEKSIIFNKLHTTTPINIINIFVFFEKYRFNDVSTSVNENS